MKLAGRLRSGTCSFICQAISTRRQRRDLGRGNPINSFSALYKNTTSELAGLFSHYPFNAERQAGKL